MKYEICNNNIVMENNTKEIDEFLNFSIILKSSNLPTKEDLMKLNAIEMISLLNININININNIKTEAEKYGSDFSCIEFTESDVIGNMASYLMSHSKNEEIKYSGYTLDSLYNILMNYDNYSQKQLNNNWLSNPIFLTFITYEHITQRSRDFSERHFTKIFTQSKNIKTISDILSKILITPYI